MNRVKIRAKGRVQGVGFRATAKHLAAQHGLHGYVKNREDGSVEMVVEGEQKAIDHFLAALEEEFTSSLTSLDVAPASSQESFHSFTIRF